MFVDDSHFECDLVRSMLPEVEVLQVPAEPEKMAGLITSSGLFDSLTFTEEDKVKNSMYRAEAERGRIREESTNLEDYLFSIELKADIQTADPHVVERVAQLTQKTNQFNLTTKRYSEDDIRRFMEDASSQVVYLKVADKVADFGIVGAAIIHIKQECAEIDTFLMSCRVLGRGIETAFLHHLIDFLMRTRNIAKVRGFYAATAKNGQVADFYPKHGFTQTEAGDFVLTLPGELFTPPAWVTIGQGLG